MSSADDQTSSTWKLVKLASHYVPGFIKAPVVWAFSLILPSSEVILTAEREAQHIDNMLPVPHPTVFIGSLQDAIQKCKTDYKFLLVYLHSDCHQDSPKFLKDVLSNQVVVDLINRNYIFWAGDVSLHGPHRIAHTLQVTGYPALMVFSPTSFVPHSLTHQLNLARIQLPLSLYPLSSISNNTNVDDIIAHLSGSIEQFSGWTTAAQNREREQIANRQLLEEQDEAYLSSLAADEARERQRRLEEEERRLAEEMEQQRYLEEARRAEEEERLAQIEAQRMEQERMEAISRIEQEPEDGPGVVYITFRAIDSSRINRRFLPTSTVQSLYDFCQSLPSTPNQFSLVTPFPRRTLSNLDQEIGQLNLNKALISIEPL